MRDTSGPWAGYHAFFILDREEVFADSAFLTLVRADTFKFLDKAAALHDLDGSLIIRKADTSDLERLSLGMMTGRNALTASVA